MSDEFLNQQRSPRRAFADALGKHLQAVEQEDAMIASNGHKKAFQNEGTKMTEIQGEEGFLHETLTPRFDTADNARTSHVSPLRTRRMSGHKRARPGLPLRLIALTAASLSILVALAVGFAPRPQEASSLVQLDTQLLPSALERITADNIDRLEVVATLGEGILLSADWSPDGETIAAGGARGVWLMRADDPAQRELLPTETGIAAVAYSPDGATIAVGGYSGEVVFYNAASRERTASRPLPATRHRGVSQLAWIDETRLAVVTLRDRDAAYGSSLQPILWTLDLSTESWTRVEPGYLPAGGVFTLGGSRYLAYQMGDEDTGLLMLLDLDSGERRTLATYTNGVQALAFSIDGSTLFAAHEFGIDRWDMTTGEELSRVDRDRLFVQIRAMAAAPDGRVLVIADTGEGYATYALDGDRLARTSEVQSYVSFPLSAAFNPAGNQYLILEVNGLRFGSLDAPQLRHIVTHNSGVAALALDDAAEALVALEWGEGQPPRLWNLGTGEGQPVRATPGNGILLLGTYFSMTSIADLSPDGTRLLTTAGNMATYTNLATSVTRWQWQMRDLVTGTFAGSDANGNPGLVLFDEGTNSVNLFETGLGAAVGEIVLPEGRLTAGAASETEVAVGRYNGGSRTASVDVYPLAALTDSETLATLGMGDHDIDALAFSRDGRWLAIGSSGLGERPPQSVDLTLWDWRTGETMVVSREENASALSDLVVSENSPLVYALSNSEGVLRAWDMVRGEMVAVLDGAARGWNVTSLALSSNERLLITGGYDGLIRVWGVRGT